MVRQREAVGREFPGSAVREHGQKILTAEFAEIAEIAEKGGNESYSETACPTNFANCITSASVVSHEHIQRTIDCSSFQT